VSETALSDDLERCLQRDGVTLGQLNDTLDERSFALVLMLLLLPSALPIPTGGVTHVLEACAVVVVLQMIVGRRDLWLPGRLERHPLGETFTGKAGPRVLCFLRWFERHSRRRGAAMLGSRVGQSVLGIVLLLFVIGALLAPPFSGLDTLPALGVVVVCIGLLLHDGLVVIGGIVAGVVGVVLTVVLGAAAWSLLGVAVASSYEEWLSPVR
jgi:hypothetical protein